MPKRDHQPHKLHAVSLAKLPNGEHADGGNLYLRVRDNSRTWLVRYTSPTGKRTRMGLGSLDRVSLAEARHKAREIVATLSDPINPVDPIVKRQAQRAEVRLANAKRMTFKQCAEALIEVKEKAWSNAKHANQWRSTMTTHVYPLLGDLPVDAIDTPLIVKCLSSIWLKTNETARRVQGRIAATIDWATAHGFRQGDNPARWQGHLDKLLADPTKVQKRGHHAALPYAQMGSFMKTLRKCEGIGARALEFAILTAARSGEVRGATWSEIDLQQGIWTAPAERMKARKEHRVPLSPQAINLLKSLPQIEGCEYVFPSRKNEKAISDMTLTAVLRRLKRHDITVHGFRSTFRDWAAECTNFSRDVAEMALAHSIPNAVEAAYRRGDLFLKRQMLMREWATFCDKENVSPAQVLPLVKEAKHAY
jgi:integrase